MSLIKVNYLPDDIYKEASSELIQQENWTKVLCSPKTGFNLNSTDSRMRCFLKRNECSCISVHAFERRKLFAQIQIVGRWGDGVRKIPGKSQEAICCFL